MTIKQLRAIKKHTQSDLATLLHKHLNTIQKWENGKTPIPDKILPKLAEIYNLPMSEIMKLKYDFSKEKISQVAEELEPYKKQINEYSNLPEKVLKEFLHTEEIILSKIEAGIATLLANGNDLETIEKLSKYQEFKKKVTEKIEQIKINL